MADVKKLYGDKIRSAKTESARATHDARSRPEAREEERLFAKFRNRAREDYRTLSRPAAATRRD